MRTTPGAIITVIIVTVNFLMAMVQMAMAKIPEPDNIIYGTTRQGVAEVRLVVEGETIDLFRVAEAPGLSGYYVLKIPIDSIEPLSTNTFGPTVEASIWVDDELEAAYTFTIGERGTIHTFHLDSADSDNDGLLDREEQYYGTNPLATDTDGDGLPDGADIDPAQADHDGDGYDDWYEIAAGTSSYDETEMPVIYVDQANDSGVEDGSKSHPYNTIREGVENAAEYYTVLVAEGFYQDGENPPLNLNRPVRVVGSSPATTVFDSGGAITGFQLADTLGEKSSIEQLTIQHAGIGINLGSSSPVIRNTIVKELGEIGILCGSLSQARIVNATITGTLLGSGVTTMSADIALTNSIISDNGEGLVCDGVTSINQNYNNFWNNSEADYIGCSSVATNISSNPMFASPDDGDYRLYFGSLSVDGGDPVELLTKDYNGGQNVVVNSVTNLEIGDRVWINNDNKTETAIVDAVTASSVTLTSSLLGEYYSETGSHLFTALSDSRKEPASSTNRVDLGAFGNTPEAGWVVFGGDINADRQVDLTDLILGMQNLTSQLHPEIPYTGDINNDKKIGIQEVIYILNNLEKHPVKRH